MRRHLHCLAETGAAAEYRRTLTGNAALVRVPSGRGVLISDRLVLTARPGRGGPAVETGTGAALHVGHVFTPESPHLNAALLQLTEPVPAPPLRLGHAVSGDALVSGVVDAFESFPEQDLDLYRVGLPVRPRPGGLRDHRRHPGPAPSQRGYGLTTA